jgi:hypothetical protein
MIHERLEKHVAAFLHVMRSTETYRSVDDVMAAARVPEDEAAEVAAYLERKKLIARPGPRLATLTPWGREWAPREQ